MCTVLFYEVNLKRVARIDLARMHWNTHLIRQSEHAEIAGGPDQMYYLSENNDYFDQLYPCDQRDINKLNSCFDIGDEDKERDKIFDEDFVYLQIYMHLSDPKTWTETKYLFMVMKTLRVLEFELSLAVW